MEKNKTNYYLFGQEVVDIYESDGIDGILEDLETGVLGHNDFDLVKFTRDSTADEILEAFIGWNAYCKIAPEDYKTLFKLRDEI